MHSLHESYSTEPHAKPMTAARIFEAAAIVMEWSQCKDRLPGLTHQMLADRIIISFSALTPYEELENVEISDTRLEELAKSQLRQFLDRRTRTATQTQASGGNRIVQTSVWEPWPLERIPHAQAWLEANP